ncbi:hypothetical protein L195_g011758 [Trifolium pratense]|uniref:Uncharacterized protein n=1 Tax=Trifolium pratense TaxID=57577 RepID=A0A2K3PIG9_TRIPR|nr:hypothetical protein L195_g011758 [Trifolium pratense]
MSRNWQKGIRRRGLPKATVVLEQLRSRVGLHGFSSLEMLALLGGLRRRCFIRIEPIVELTEEIYVLEEILASYLF